MFNEPFDSQEPLLFFVIVTGCTKYSPLAIFDEFLEVIRSKLGQWRNIQPIEDCRLIGVDSTV
jgi:hypothetical protein